MEGAAAVRSMIIQIVIGQSQLDHRLSRRLTVFGDVDADFILGSDFGRDPSPLGGGGAEPNVGTHFHFGLNWKCCCGRGWAKKLNATSSNDEIIVRLLLLLLRSVIIIILYC